MTGALDIASPRKWAKDIIKALGSGKTFGARTYLPGGATRRSSDERGGQGDRAPRRAFQLSPEPGTNLRCTRGRGVEPGELGINGGTSCNQ